jgi:hypothetical protein
LLEVYLCVSADFPKVTLQLKEVAATFFVPLSYLLQHMYQPNLLYRWPISVPYLPDAPTVIRWLGGEMQFPSVLLTECSGQNSPILASPHSLVSQFDKRELRLWGLTLWVTSDLLDLMFPPTGSTKTTNPKSLVCSVTTFSHPDVAWLLRQLYQHPNQVGQRSSQKRYRKEACVHALYKDLFNACRFKINSSSQLWTYERCVGISFASAGLARILLFWGIARKSKLIVKALL